MDRAQAKQILATLTEELTAVERRAGSLRKLIEGYTELFPDLIEDVEDRPAPTDRSDRPRGMDAVMRVFKDAQGKWFTVRLMTMELQRRGWEPDSDDPESAVRTTLARAYSLDPERIHKGRGQKTGQVTYAYRDSWLHHEEAPQPEANGSAALEPAPNGSAAAAFPYPEEVQTS